MSSPPGGSVRQGIFAWKTLISLRVPAKVRWGEPFFQPNWQGSSLEAACLSISLARLTATTRVLLLDYTRVDLTQGFSFQGNQSPLGLTLVGGSQQVEAWLQCQDAWDDRPMTRQEMDLPCLGEHVASRQNRRDFHLLMLFRFFTLFGFKRNLSQLWCLFLWGPKANGRSSCTLVVDIVRV